MKTTRKSAIILIFLSFCFSISYTYAQKNSLDTIKIKTSAVCEICKEKIEKALAYEKGVKFSDLDLTSKVVTVIFKPEKTNPEKIRKAITMAGYDADFVPADSKAYKELSPCCKKGYDGNH